MFPTEVQSHCEGGAEDPSEAANGENIGVGHDDLLVVHADDAATAKQGAGREANYVAVRRRRAQDRREEDGGRGQVRQLMEEAAGEVGRQERRPARVGRGAVVGDGGREHGGLSSRTFGGF